MISHIVQIRLHAVDGLCQKSVIQRRQNACVKTRIGQVDRFGIASFYTFAVKQPPPLEFINGRLCQRTVDHATPGAIQNTQRVEYLADIIGTQTTDISASKRCNFYNALTIKLSQRLARSISFDVQTVDKGVFGNVFAKSQPAHDEISLYEIHYFVHNINFLLHHDEFAYR